MLPVLKPQPLAAPPGKALRGNQNSKLFATVTREQLCSFTEMGNLQMRVQRILCFAAALLLPELAVAKLPFSNELFGKAEGTLDFCSQVDPPRAEKYQEKKKLVVKDLPEKEVAEARESDEYKSAYKSTTEEAAKGPKDEAVKSCGVLLQSNN